MIDAEKIIKALENCVQYMGDCINCEYLKHTACKTSLMIDALAALKEQEPKQIVRKQGKRENSDGSIDYFAEWYCPHCGKLLNRGFDLPWIEFCYKCGKAVKWE